jgi:hypothetical protein
MKEGKAGYVRRVQFGNEKRDAENVDAGDAFNICSHTSWIQVIYRVLITGGSPESIILSRTLVNLSRVAQGLPHPLQCVDDLPTEPTAWRGI